MSFRGLKKGMLRAPQQMRQKLNMGTTTHDPVYEDAERRFQELEIETKKLLDELDRYFKAVNGMLEHQIGFSKAIEEIYKPISGRMLDPNSLAPEGNPEGVAAAELYRAVVQELQTTLKPDLELIEKRIVEPAKELLKVIELIRKMATKRAHKQLDLDRHLTSFNKYDKKTAADSLNAKLEEKKYKAEAEMEAAQEEYNYYNEMLKQDLPVLFQLEAQFVKPLFVLLYFMQLNIFYTLYSRMEELKIPYFDLHSDIVEAFTAKRGDIQEQTEAIGLTHFKVGHAKHKLEMTKKRYGKDAEGTQSPASAMLPEPLGYSSPVSPVGAAPAYGGYGQPALPATAAPAYGQPATTAQGYPNEKAQYAPAQAAAYGAAAATAAPAAYGAPPAAYSAPPAATAAPGGYVPPAAAAPPTYTPPPTQAATTAQGYPNEKAAYAPPGGYAPPTPAPAAPAAPAGQQTCTALYPYTAAAAGDLTFPEGAIITITSQGADGWWTGLYNGVSGVFPGNYVQPN